ncbi:hypothetical protein GCM10023195_76860 [Actinoallomurus liliacearum]|uniref:Uncharacterized protein n=1 Tax=Actinoallomurus liliacearum TaxID=1080073 RepID=A0ABP8TV70_9ACTN
MTVTADQFDGEFMHVDAADVRQHDIILGGARPVIAPPVPTTGGGITVTTTNGPETFTATAPVHVFRPAPGTIGEECPECYSAPGEPCAPHCLSYATLDDAAGTDIA